MNREGKRKVVKGKQKWNGREKEVGQKEVGQKEVERKNKGGRVTKE